MASIIPFLEIAGRSVAVYLFMILAIKFFGKKELSQLSVIDLVFILLISNSVQNAMVGPALRPPFSNYSKQFFSGKKVRPPRPGENRAS
ncbi:MAG: hypothetical protein IPN88_02260 [Bacteroidetes bacterium]|nr:hypothetical protein [Bacteroidota bacterium]